MVEGWSELHIQSEHFSPKSLKAIISSKYLLFSPWFGFEVQILGVTSRTCTSRCIRKTAIQASHHRTGCAHSYQYVILTILDAKVV